MGVSFRGTTEILARQEDGDGKPFHCKVATRITINKEVKHLTYRYT